MRTPEEAKDVSRRFMDEVFNKRNLKHAEEMLSADFVEHSPLSPEMGSDRTAAMDGFRFLLDSSDDLRADIIEQVSDGRRVAIRARYSGTDTGGFVPGMSPTGKRFDIEGIDVAIFNEDGRFSEHYGIADLMVGMAQLGVGPGGRLKPDLTTMPVSRANDAPRFTLTSAQAGLAQPSTLGCGS